VDATLCLSSAVPFLSCTLAKVGVVAAWPSQAPDEWGRPPLGMPRRVAGVFSACVPSPVPRLLPAKAPSNHLSWALAPVRGAATRMPCPSMTPWQEQQVVHYARLGYLHVGSAASMFLFKSSREHTVRRHTARPFCPRIVFSHAVRLVACHSEKSAG